MLVDEASFCVLKRLPSLRNLENYRSHIMVFRGLRVVGKNVKLESF